PPLYSLSMPYTTLFRSLFPKSAIVLKNEEGTAPGCIMGDKTKYILMPGPPNELRAMFDREVVRRLSTDQIIRSINCKIAILGERSEEHTSELQSRFDLV